MTRSMGVAKTVQERRFFDRASGSNAESPFRATSSSARRRIIYSAVFLGVLLASAIGVSLWANYLSVLEEEETRLRIMADSFGNNLRLSIKSIDSVLRLVADHVSLHQAESGENLEQLLVELRASNPFIGDLILVDHQGWVTLDARQPYSPKTKHFNVSDRDYFLAQANNPSEALFFGQPTTNRRHGNRVVPISRSIHGKDGEWKGIVAISLDQQYFSSLFSSLAGPNKYQALVIGDAGKIYAHFPQRTITEGARWSPEPEFEKLLSVEESGAFKGVPFVGAGEQIIYHSTPTGSPFRLILGIDRSDALAPYFHSLHASIGVLVGGIILILIGAGLELRRSANLLAQAEELDQKLKFESLLRSISAELINIPLDDLAGSLSIALGRIGEFRRLSMVAGFEFSLDRERLVCSYAWMADRAKVDLEEGPILERSVFKWLFAGVEQGDEIPLSSLADIPLEATAERAFYSRMGNRSLVLSPFFIQGQVAGFFISVAGDIGQLWSNRVQAQRALGVQVLASGIARLRHGQTLVEQVHLLEQEYKFVVLVAEIAAHFVNKGPGEIDTVLDQSLQKLAQFIEVDRAFICLFSADGDHLTYSHEWCNVAAKPRVKGLSAVDGKDFPWAFSRLRAGTPLLVSNLDQLPTEAAKERSMFQRIGIRSFARTPISVAGETLGFLGFDSQQGERDWPDYIAARLRLVGQVFAGTFVRMREEEVRERLISILEGTSDFVGTATMDGVPTYLNRAGREMLGIGLDEPVKNFNAWDSYAVSQLKSFLPELEKTGFWSGEGELISRTGEPIPVSQVVLMHSALAGGDKYISNIARDISDQKRQEKERERLEIQVRQLQKLEALGTLAGGIAHDFNNILGAAFGHLELAQVKLEIGHPAGAHLTELAKAAMRARDLVRQILTFSRQDEPRREPLQIYKLVGEALALIKASLPASIKIVEEIQRADQPVVGDASQLHQVVLNLCTNAAQAMPAGGSLQVSLSQEIVASTMECTTGELAPGNYYRLGVKDSGQGIPVADLERIFDPFFTTKGVNQGTGLGLSTVHGIVTAHQGVIDVASEVGQGARFDVYLPISEQALSVHEEPSKVESGKGQKVLFVDDEPMLVSLAEKLLGQLGYQVECHGRAESALASFRESAADFDLVMTDMSMPGMTGMDLAKALKKSRPDIPVILLSGFIDNQIDAGADQSLIDAIMQKPVSLADLAKVIAKVLEESGAEGRY